MNPCDQFTVGDILPGGFVILRIVNGRVFLGGLAIGGEPIEVSFDCATFYQGFYALLDLLGIHHP